MCVVVFGVDELKDDFYLLNGVGIFVSPSVLVTVELKGSILL